ncbi:MAG: RNA 2',3'-cyclic phosphodiesterase [Eggerthellaceae bacterium]|nr:RNA 2',3'-cyclic phosphodiesterase [Eggerthellaceae bacterium]
MRLFIATELPSELLEALAETQADLRASIKGRYVSPDSFHVTLAFLSNVESWRVNDIAELLDEACANQAPFAATLAELGFFGRRGKAALWQGFAGKAAFTSLAQRVRENLSREGFDFDGKGFLPHVTLMRGADLSTGTLPMPAVAHGTVDTVSLFQSDLSGERPIYTALHRVLLQSE